MPLNGENEWTGVGEVRQQVRTGKVGGGVVCSFEIAVPSRGGQRIARVRVNVYEAKAVRYAQRHLKEGVFVRVMGEIMNRRRRGKGPRLVEIRASKLEAVPPKENENGTGTGN